MTLNYYVYYRVPPENAESARAAIARLQEELASRAGVSGRLLRRRDDATTWMEVYEDVHDAAKLESALAELVREHGVGALLQPGTSRRQEIFRSF